MNTISILLCWINFALILGKVFGQLCRDHAGKQFVIVYFPLSETNDHFLQLHVYSAYKRSVKVNLQTPLVTGSSRLNTDFTVPSQSYILVNIANLHYFTENVRNERALVISAEDDLMIYACSGKPGHSAAYQIYPIDFFGVEYYVMTYQPTTGSDDRAMVSVVAVYEETKIKLQFAPTSDLELIIDGITYRTSETFEFSLGKYETFLFSAKYDLTGTRIKGSKPFAVFSGNKNVKIDNNGGYTDHIMEQMPPKHIWGNEFIITLYPRQQTRDIVRLINAFSVTELEISIDANPTYSVVLSSEEIVFNVSFQSYMLLKSSFPVLLAHFGSENKNGDAVNASATMSIVQPVNNHVSKYYLATPVYNITADAYKHYAVIIINEKIIPQAQIEGQKLDGYEWQDINNTNYKYREFLISDNGLYSIESKNVDATFGGYLYGYSEKQSYAASLSAVFDEPIWERTGDIYSSKLKFVTKDQLPYRDPIFESNTRSSLDCHRLCLDNVDCGAVALYKSHSNTQCKVYGYEDRCDPMMSATGYKLYARSPD